MIVIWQSAGRELAATIDTRAVERPLDRDEGKIQR
jgi:hypothetical protein